MDSTYLILDELIGMLPIILCGCVLPIMVVWFVVRKKINETNARTQIVTAAIEKNPQAKTTERETAHETAVGLHCLVVGHRFDRPWHLHEKYRIGY